jgi:hypothetical protein
LLPAQRKHRVIASTFFSARRIPSNFKKCARGCKRRGPRLAPRPKNGPKLRSEHRIRSASLFSFFHTYSLTSLFCFFRKICVTYKRQTCQRKHKQQPHWKQSSINVFMGSAVTLFSTITASRPLCSPTIGVSDPTRPLRVTRDEAPSVTAVKELTISRQGANNRKSSAHILCSVPKQANAAQSKL